MNGSGSVDGVLVIPPSVYQTFPVGLSGVPPQVQVEVAVACAGPAPNPPAATDAAAMAVMARIARGLISHVSFRSRPDGATGGDPAPGGARRLLVAVASPCHPGRLL